MSQPGSVLVNLYWTECVWVVGLMDETDLSNAWLMPVSIFIDMHVRRKLVALTEWACHLSTARQVCDCDVIAPCLLPYSVMYRSRWLCVSLAESTRPISRPAAGNQ